MNWYFRSILNRVLTIVIATNLVVALAAGYSLKNALDANDDYSRLAGAEMPLALEAQDILVAFKTQVQEWKNVLLRGADDSRRQKYWGQFQEQESRIQARLERLIPQLTDPEARQLMSRFQSAHRQMGDAYRSGFQAFVDAGYRPAAGDAAVTGIDREPAQLIEQAAARIRDLGMARAEHLNNRVAADATRNGVLMFLAILLGTLACVIVLMRSVVRPAQQLIAQMNRLGQGDLTQPVTLQRQGAAAQQVTDFVHALEKVFMEMVRVVLLASPLGIGSLVMAKVMGACNLGDSLKALSLFMVTVLLALAVQGLVVLPLVYLSLTRRNPLRVLRAFSPAFVSGFGTDSSTAALPVTLECARALGVPDPVSRFVLPLGATINMDGTALYQAVAVLFIAQIYGVDLVLADQLIIVLTATLASVGAAGVPSAGIITLIIVLNSVGMGEHVQAGIALILGVDRILDMIRTSVNVTGDITCSAVIARSEGETLTLVNGVTAEST